MANPQRPPRTTSMAENLQVVARCIPSPALPSREESNPALPFIPTCVGLDRSVNADGRPNVSLIKGSGRGAGGVRCALPYRKSHSARLVTRTQRQLPCNGGIGPSPA